MHWSGVALIALRHVALSKRCRLSTPWRRQCIGGAAVYIFGTIVFTMICNVPANNSLAT
ncbi:DUF1772 domain-containing protein [Novosphingobium hassiacum]|uniref:DUF1772 domain-containing protein n=1 Tax=Novosphingobium hassiacum TaxID=173676 RepID=UPI003CCDF7D4